MSPSTEAPSTLEKVYEELSLLFVQFAEPRIEDLFKLIPQPKASGIFPGLIPVRAVCQVPHHTIQVSETTQLAKFALKSDIFVRSTVLGPYLRGTLDNSGLVLSNVLNEHLLGFDLDGNLADITQGKSDLVE